MTKLNADKGNDLVKLHDALFLHEAKKTRLIQVHVYPGYTEKVWFPISQSVVDDDGGVWVKRWLVNKKGKKMNEQILLDKQFE